jgi:UPF0042 nucleotide-binding protein
MDSPNNDQNQQLGLHRIDVVITSCGELHGPMPAGHAHFVDLRTALRNPADNTALIDMNGLDPDVIQHVLATPGAEELIDTTVRHIQAALHINRPRGHRADAVAMCRGGRHRSVTIAEAVAHRLRAAGIGVEVEHRDIHKPVIRTSD